ncbi:hypothetical protein THIOM_000643 [Candidatus Thiomargarita nelsonii]|uniref:Uncharacterized protein n=1 Tax=Candidatus Thiomargarita nelsonii TaxID=1003181 RepID=A0A176S6E3_9GAMM|nr:hypothetical protein THIOM_000643 [Candidatus Thiomargarita nelsonii]
MKPYAAKFSIKSNISVDFFSLTPRATAPSRNTVLCSAISLGFFLPIQLWAIKSLATKLWVSGILKSKTSSLPIYSIETISSQKTSDSEISLL